MPTQYGILGMGTDIALLLGWFENLDLPKATSEREETVWLHFVGLGSLQKEGEDVNQTASPLACIIKPRKVRGVLWTTGEVVFTPTPLRAQFPALHAVTRSFKKWLFGFERVFDRRRPDDCLWSYYLEGSIRNFDVDLFALPEAYKELRNGQYFVHHRDNPTVVDDLCRQLRLRGIECDEAL